MAAPTTRETAADLQTESGAGPGPRKRMVVFRGDEAPTLEETGMMEVPVFVEETGPIPEAFGARLDEASRLTVPFQEDGPEGLSLVVIDFAPGFMLPRHSHSSDCLYYVIEGELVMGRQTLGAGDGFFLPAEHPYGYHAGPRGVKLLEFRNRTTFDMKIWEKDAARYVERAGASLDEASRGA